MAKTADELGTYEVKGQKIWPLVSGTTVAAATTPVGPIPVGANAPNSVVLGTFGILDLLVIFPTNSPVKRSTVNAANPTPVKISGAGVQSAPIVGFGDVARICFAVKLATAATKFTGTLKLTSHVSGNAVTASIPIQVRANTEEKDGVLMFGLIASKKAYTWMVVKAIDSGGSGAVTGATVQVRYLRDNGIVANFNREFPLMTTPSGNVGSNATRIKLCVPVDWPITFDIHQANFVRRAHMLEVKAASATGHDNGNPIAAPDSKSTKISAANLSTKTFVLDPGHGVAYAHAAKRSQEWLAAFKTAQKIREILRDRHHVPDANIKFTRTAGIGLVEPDKVDDVTALKKGHDEFTIDLNTPRTLHTVGTIPLKRVGSLLTTQHRPTVPFDFIALTADERKAFLDANKTLVNAMVTRQLAKLARRTLVPNSVRWDETLDNYVFDSAPPAGTKTPTNRTHGIDATPRDVFPVTDPMLRTLAERTARWSFNREVEGLKTNTPSAYGQASQQAMLLDGGLLKAVEACVKHAAGPHKNPFPPNANLAPTLHDRQQDLKGMNPRPDILLTLHHNAAVHDSDPARGVTMLIVDQGLWTEEHLRLQKTMLKYVNGLGLGLRESGMIKGHEVRMEGPDPNHTAARYAFFETEFMNSPREDGTAGFKITQLLARDFTDAYAEDIVAAIVEFLLDQQDHASFDPVDIGAGVHKGTVHW